MTGCSNSLSEVKPLERVELSGSGLSHLFGAFERSAHVLSFIFRARLLRMKIHRAIATPVTQIKLNISKDMPMFAPIVRPVWVEVEDAGELDRLAVELCSVFFSGSGVHIPFQLDAYKDCPPIDAMVVLAFWRTVTAGVIACDPGAWAIHHFEVFQFMPMKAAWRKERPRWYSPRACVSECSGVVESRRPWLVRLAWKVRGWRVHERRCESEIEERERNADGEIALRSELLEDELKNNNKFEPHKWCSRIRLHSRVEANALSKWSE